MREVATNKGKAEKSNRSCLTAISGKGPGYREAGCCCATSETEDFRSKDERSTMCGDAFAEPLHVQRIALLPTSPAKVSHQAAKQGGRGDIVNKAHEDRDTGNVEGNSQSVRPQTVVSGAERFRDMMPGLLDHKDRVQHPGKTTRNRLVRSEVHVDMKDMLLNRLKVLRVCWPVVKKGGRGS